MDWSDSAVVLSLGRFRENDVWLKLMTKRHGLTHAFAFGGSRSRRRFSGCLDILNLLRVHASTSRNGQFLHLTEAALQGGPRRMRTDVRRLGPAMNCIRFVEALDVPPDGSEDVFTLLCDMLQWLEASEDPPPLAFPVLFRLRLASAQGYAPVFSMCGRCAESLAGKNGVFSLTEGAVLCTTCGEQQLQAAMIRAETLGVLAKVQDSLPSQWHLEDASASTLRESVRVVDDFVQYHLGLVWDRGRFRRF